ncbi:Denitrification system component NirT [Polynucleobacter tropicus]|uniref:Cytochrome c-type protein n=1 Tax=Polynucleobacter tropicus TaxID=1743174 RepID=A0A6M9PY48_9BURK|nr:NapC/NirT family cytochrome c [Polynucleobacter tropicus]QKM65181.1 Denitrification system component NirT [Polynucleobacter tropicus]
MNREPGALKKLWAFLKKPSAKYSILAISVTGFIAGILFWGAFNTGMEATNTLAFCTTCHEMRDTVYQEYKETIHYSNRSGVRAICSDCHVPKDWVHKMIRKSKASFEVWGKITGSIDTPEKFEAKRMELAGHEWKRMKESNSRECRNCHDFDAMSPELQKQTPYKKHMKAKEAGKTCIDCHKGIAHHLPKEYEEPDDD